LTRNGPRKQTIYTLTHDEHGFRSNIINILLTISVCQDELRRDANSENVDSEKISVIATIRSKQLVLGMFCEKRNT